MFELNWTPQSVYTEKMIEDFAQSRELIQSMKGVLKSKPNNIHYHFKRKKCSGVLEVTVFQNALQINVHDNRNADWIEFEIEAWKKKFI